MIKRPQKMLREELNGLSLPNLVIHMLPHVLVKKKGLQSHMKDIRNIFQFKSKAHYCEQLLKTYLRTATALMMPPAH